MKPARISTLVLACLCAVAGAFRVTAAEDVPQPVDLGTKDVSVYIEIPNLLKTLDSFDAIGKQFNPQQAPGMAKMQLGFMLGDPSLTNLDTTKPIVAMVFKTPPSDTPSGPPPFAVFIPCKAASPFDQAFTRLKLVSAFANGVLVVAQTPDALTKGQAQLDAYGKIADAKVQGDVRIFLSIGNLMESYGPLIQKGMDMVTQQLAMFGGSMQTPGAGGDPQMLGKIATVEMKVAAELLNEIDAMQYDLTFKADQVAVDTLLVSKKGSPLADLFAAPPLGTNKALPLLTRSGALVGGGRLNPAGNQTFVSKVLDLIAKDPTGAEIVTKEFRDLTLGSVGLLGGDFAMSMDATSVTSGLSMEMVMTVKDEKAYVNYLESTPKLFGPDTALGKLYAGLGMKMEFTFQKAVRQHAGVDVHRLKISFDTSKLPPAQAARFKNMPHETDIALVNGFYLASYDPADLDKLIDKAVASGAPKPDVSLESITAFGEGKQAYFDVDVVGFAKSITATMPGNPAGAMLGQLKSKAPILAAASYNAGRVLTQIRVPLAPLVELSTLSRKSRQSGAASRSGQGNGQEPKKDDKF